MLARRSVINCQGRRIAETPLLVPAFSSRGFPDISKIIAMMKGSITESLLVSAYDICHNKIDVDFGCAGLVVLDSGGYEHSRRSDLSDLRYVDYAPDKEWTEDLFRETLGRWPSGPEYPSTVAISYDGPGPHMPFEDQVTRAHDLLHGSGPFVRELLIKPETEGQQYVQHRRVIENIELLGGFDIVGFTEKELGHSMLQRMERIASIRLGMDDAGINSPIHVLGGLDPMSTPLYYISGAEVFDGLSWLRLAYDEGRTVYKYNYGAVRLGLDVTDDNVEYQCWVRNLNALRELQLEMRAFQVTGDFAKFKFNGPWLEESFGKLQGRLRRHI